MKKILFLLLVLITFSGCYMEQGMYVHRHPWSSSYRAHRYYAPRFVTPYKRSYRGRW